MPLFEPNLLEQISRELKVEICSKTRQDKIGDLPAGFCGNLSSYMMDLIISDSDNIDFIFIKRNNEVCGMLFVEKEICPEHASWWVLRLVCNNQFGDCKGVATLLVKCYIQCLKATSQPMGVLELYDGMKNIKAYNLYYKEGFRIDPAFLCTALGSPIIMTIEI